MSQQQSELGKEQYEMNAQDYIKAANDLGLAQGRADAFVESMVLLKTMVEDRAFDVEALPAIEKIAAKFDQFITRALADCVSKSAIIKAQVGVTK